MFTITLFRQSDAQIHKLHIDHQCCNFPSMLIEVSIQRDVPIILDDEYPPIRKISKSNDGVVLDQKFDQVGVNQ